MQNYLYGLATDREKGLIASGVKVFLSLLSLVYGLAVFCVSSFYLLKPCRLSCKVISVGNITLGGTGKTSLVEFIARYLQAKGHKVAILSRGYKRRAMAYRPSVIDYESMGDEPFMLSRKLGGLPVIVDKDRVKAARQAIKDFGADTVILDDGMQQWRIKKDLEIVAIDATQPFGNRQLIPRGILRQPLAALKRADVFVITKTNLASNTGKLKELLNRLSPRALVIESAHTPVGLFNLNTEEPLSLEALSDKAVGLFSGIADPDSFERLVGGLGINIAFCLRFPDHHHYGQKDWEAIIRSCRDKNTDTILTTEKDACRLSGFSAERYGLRVLFLRITLKVTDEQRMHNRVLRLYSA